MHINRRRLFWTWKVMHLMDASSRHRLRSFDDGIPISSNHHSNHFHIICTFTFIYFAETTNSITSMVDTSCPFIPGVSTHNHFYCRSFKDIPIPLHLPGSLKLPTRRTRERTDRPWVRELSESTGTISLCRQGGVVKHKARKGARRATEFLLPPYSKRFVGLECVLLLAG